MKDDKIAAPFRIAVREDEQSVRFYMAKHDTMIGAVPILMMAKNVAYLHQEVRDATLALASAIGKHLCIQMTGAEPVEVQLSDPPPEGMQKS